MPKEKNAKRNTVTSRPAGGSDMSGEALEKLNRELARLNRKTLIQIGVSKKKQAKG